MAAPERHPQLLQLQLPSPLCDVPAPQVGQVTSASYTSNPLANSTNCDHWSRSKSSVAPSAPSLPSFTPTEPEAGRAT